MAVSKQQKQIALVAGAALVLILIYKWYSSQQAGAASTGAAAPDTASGDYASLAGQEQSDVAALQGQNSQLLSQEQSDVAALQGSLGGLTGQEQADISGLTGSIAGFSDQFDQLTQTAGLIPALTSQVAALSAGVTQLNRAQSATVQTHRGGPLYNYYVKVTGKAPPANIATSNFVYQAWKSGVNASALQKTPAHPSSQNTQIAHPNGSHTQQAHHPPAPAKAAPKPATKPSASKPQPAKTAPRQLPKPKPKTSGTRK